MALYSAFEPTGLTATLQTNSTLSTNQTTGLLTLAAFGITLVPEAFRMINNGTVDIWVVWSASSSVTAAFPVAGTTTIGTPAAGFRLKPNIVEVFRFNAWNTTAGGFYIATICSVASQAFDMTPGEGV